MDERRPTRPPGPPMPGGDRPPSHPTPRGVRSAATQHAALSTQRLVEVASVAELRAVLAARPEPVGLVPTMGYLHEGHVSLARRARAENATVVLSLFVNPTQFGPNEDYARYPRDLEHDRAVAAAAGVDVLWVPAVEDVYPPG